jgi:crotonobetainyl-CoA:carnitine CoA-transferase CaiB-like acyl-CoA transferase
MVEDTVWRALGGGPDRPAAVRWTGPVGVLPSRLPVGALARAAVAGYGLAALELAAARTGRPATAPLRVDAGAVATAFTSERHLRLDGRAYGSFAPLSRFWRAADGWVRTHGNYPHHRARLLAALGVPEPGDVDTVARVVGGMPAVAVEEAVSAAGGLAVAVRTPREWAAHPQGRAVSGLPLVTLRQAVAAPVRGLPPVPPGRPATGVRVLDLTRVIAGPVGTRALALLGADVLRVDSPRLPELDGQYLDTGFGKRSTGLDLATTADRRVFEELLAGADVVVTGYRPGALDRFGLAPPALLERRPGLVVAQLSAWGPTGPWAARRGFDSLVQAATGIALLERPADAGGAGPGERGARPTQAGPSERGARPTQADPGERGARPSQADPGQPGALPAQALDHGTGYLLAAAVLRALTARLTHGGGWWARLSLAQIAWWLVTGGLPADPPAAGGYRPDDWCTETVGELGRFRHARPALTLPEGPLTWAHPPGPWGADRPTWRT